jgi:hypothetical protein
MHLSREEAERRIQNRFTYKSELFETILRIKN